jgi:hypothetical protein
VQPLLLRKCNNYYIFWVCNGSLSHPACNKPVWLYHVFPHYLINVTIFEKKLLSTKCVFLCSLQLLCEMFFILRRTERDVIRNVYLYPCKVPVILSVFNKIWTLLIDFRKIPTYKISWKFLQWEPSCSMRTEQRTDRRYEANNHFSPFNDGVWEFYILLTEYNSVLCIDFQIKSRYLLIQHQLIDFYTRDWACLLRGTSSILKYFLSDTSFSKGCISPIFLGASRKIYISQNENICSFFFAFKNRNSRIENRNDV